MISGSNQFMVPLMVNGKWGAWTISVVADPSTVSITKATFEADIAKAKTEPQEVMENGEKKGGGCCGSLVQKLTRLANGAVGMLKSELGIDGAEPEMVYQRRAICENCPSGCYDFGVCDESKGGCGCFLAAKVVLKSEKCPHGHW